MDSLGDRLKSLGISLGMPKMPSPQPGINCYPIENVVNGFDQFNAYGRVFAMQSDYPKNHSHGNMVLTDPIDVSRFGEVEKSLVDKNIDSRRMIFLDTETSGLAGGSGTFAFLVGLAHWTIDGFRLVQFFMRDPAEEPALLAGLGAYLAAFDVVVTFNGKTFDIPILKTRHVIHQQPSPFQDYKHIDILYVARRLWRNRFTNRALGNLENEILGVKRALNEVPGWMIPMIYMDYLRSQDARPLEGVFYHNGMDVISLAALFLHISNILSHPLEKTISTGFDQVAIGYIYEERGRLGEAAELIEQGIHRDLPVDLRIIALLKCASIYRRQKEWGKAAGLWQQAAALKSMDAMICLAKYYEHEIKDITQALMWTDAGLDYLTTNNPPLYIVQLQRKELLHRKKRLTRLLS